jgi:hypothetical protein
MRNSFYPLNNLIDTLVHMNSSKNSFFKGLQGFTRHTDELLLKDAENSVYYWWWAFMRLSPVFWYANQTGLKPVDLELTKTLGLVGDLTSGSFGTWWRATGRKIFAEANHPAKLRLIDIDQADRVELYERSVVIEVPLTISRATLQRQFKKLLAEQHEGRLLNIAATSNAKLQLHTKRFNIRTLEIEYWVMLYRLLNQDIAIWRIGDRLQLSPSLKVRGVERTNADVRQGTSAFDKLHSLTGRYLYKAQYTLNHAEHGSFPNSTKVKLTSKPFGEKHDLDYRAATGQVINVPSEWHAWLDKQLSRDLKHEIIKRNRLDQSMRMPDGNTRRRFDAFLQGTSDLLS